MSSDNQNLFEAMRIAGLVGNVRFPHDTARWLSAPEVWRMATAGGAKALGFGDDLGAIEPGRKADLVLLRADSTFLRPLNDVMGSLVYVETGAAVDTVLVDGRVIVRAFASSPWTRTACARAQEAADRIRVKNAAAWIFAAEMAPYLSTACRAVAAAPYPVNRYAAPVG